MGCLKCGSWVEEVDTEKGGTWHKNQKTGEIWFKDARTGESWRQQRKPAWWTVRGVLSANAMDDYAAVNQGQLKWIAWQAYLEMEEKLAGGAGVNITTMVQGWKVANAQRDDYAVVNAGQVKTIAKLFYDRLIEIGEASSYPWERSGRATDNYVLVNIGQVKQLFSFELSGETQRLMGDLDGNGIPDAWEMTHFGRTGVDPFGDEDGDGISNWMEWFQGTDPCRDEDRVAMQAVKLEIYSP